MKNLSTLLVLFFISFTLIISCKKDGLTKATQNGANTFSCKINGTAFQPCQNQGLFGGPTLYGGVSVSTIATATINAECNNPYPQRHVSIYIDNFKGTGEYNLQDTANNICKYQEYVPDKNYLSFYTKTGKVTITKDDRTNFILSGTFEFTAANKDSLNDIVTVTSGRFDISYK